MSALITNAERLALSVIGNNKGLSEARSGVAPGKYDVDFVVRIKGVLSVAPDTEVAPTAKIDTTMILVVFLKRLGYSREGAIELITKLNDKLAEMTPDQKKTLMSESGFAEAEGLFKAEVIASMGKSPRRGAVRGDLEFEFLSNDSRDISSVDMDIHAVVDSIFED